MNKINPDISVFSTIPNNGYMAMVFTEDGVVMAADCKKKDIYRGLLEISAHFLLDSIDELRPKPGEEDYSEKADRYAEAVELAYDNYCEALHKGMTIDCTRRQLEDTGLPEPFASMLANGMEALPGEFKRVDDDEYDEEEDDSDDAYNLD